MNLDASRSKAERDYDMPSALRLACLALAFLTTPALAQDGVLQGKERAQTLAALSASVQSTVAATGAFIQTNPNGARVTGSYWIQRPGKVRFDYDAPSPLILVADGKTVAVRDRALKTTDRFAQSASPLSLVLKSRIDFATDARVSKVERRGAQIAVTAREKKGGTDGEVTMVFDETRRALQEWIIRDGSGQATRVVLASQTASVLIDSRTFDWRELIKDRPFVPKR